jgi:mannose-1-phosphate guanylyltransferase/phosphomannomutase
MFTGLQVLEPAVFDFMSDAARKFSTTRETYPKMLAAGAPLAGFCFQGFWQDLGTAERIREAETTLASGRTALHYL